MRGFVEYMDWFDLQGLTKDDFTKVSFNDGLDICPTRFKFWSRQSLTLRRILGITFGMDENYVFRTNLKMSERYGIFKKINHREIAEYLITMIDGVDDVSITNVVRIMSYESYLRMYGVRERWADMDYLEMKYIHVDSRFISNIKIMNERIVKMMEHFNSEVVDAVFDFDGGYNKLIDFELGDLLTEDTLWVVTLNTIDGITQNDILKLIIQYIMSIHACRDFNIEYLGILNPWLNEVYYIRVVDIPKTEFIDVIYNAMLYSNTDLDSGDSSKDWSVRDKLIITSDTYDSMIKKVHHLNTTKFEVDDYSDGIHEISKDDYRSFIKSYVDFWIGSLKLHLTDKVYLLKKNEGYMFISKNYSGSLCILNRGRVKKLEHDIQYYYDNLEKYRSNVIQYYHRYFEYVTWLTKLLSFGRDIDLDSLSIDGVIKISAFTRVFVNPLDGAIIPYMVIEPYSRTYYSSITDALYDGREFNNIMDDSGELNIDESTKQELEDLEYYTGNSDIAIMDHLGELANDSVFVNNDIMNGLGRDIHNVSKYIKGIYEIYSDGLIVEWDELYI